MFVTSCVLCFSTSKSGWIKLATGDLRSKPDGEEDGWHAALIKTWDFKREEMILQNSWGPQASEYPRVKFEALHAFYVVQVRTHTATQRYTCTKHVQVFFTLDTIPRACIDAYERHLRSLRAKRKQTHMFRWHWGEEGLESFSTLPVCFASELIQYDLNYFSAELEEKRAAKFGQKERPWVAAKMSDFIKAQKRSRRNLTLYEGTLSACADQVTLVLLDAIHRCPARRVEPSCSMCQKWAVAKSRCALTWAG